MSRKAEVVKAAETAASASTTTTQTVTETVVTKRSYASSAVSEAQQKASVTPVRSSARIAAILEKEVIIVKLYSQCSFIPGYCY